MLTNLTPLLSDFLTVVALLFALSLILHVVLLLPTFITHRIVSRVTGVDVRS